MKPHEVLKAAWKAVEDSGVPSSVHEVAFKEAVRLLGEETPRAPGIPTEIDRRDGPSTDFFARLAAESGVDEADLREVLDLDEEAGVISVLTPTRKLGSQSAEQTRLVTILVVGAQHGGLGEVRPNAKNAREECQRKNCYNVSHHSEYIAEINGMNLKGSRDSAQFIVTPRWTEEFQQAVARARGTAADAG
jgi:hypothetical protein